MYAYTSGSQQCNDGISGMAGVVGLTIVGRGAYVCKGNSNIAFDPPLTDVTAVITTNSIINYTNCGGLYNC